MTIEPEFDSSNGQIDAPSTPTGGARRWLVWGPVFGLIIGLIALLGWGMIRPSTSGPSSFSTNDGPARVAVLDRPAADFALPLIDSTGSEFQLSDYEGQTVVLNFWASWCAPCRDEAPALEEAWRLHEGEDVVFIGVNTWDNLENAQIFMREFGVTFPNALDEPGTTAVEYGMRGIPETYIITPDGMISRKIIGGVTVDSMTQAIADAQGSGSN